MDVRIIRSKKRKKTVGARVVDGVIEIRAPAAISESELKPIVRKLVARLENREAKKALNDADLERWARSLNKRFFAGRLRWSSIVWVTNQRNRVGSCTQSNGTVRISHKIAEMPAFVRDYVIVHELAHLKEANHSPKFWKLVNRYPLSERARGYLMAAAKGATLGLRPSCGVTQPHCLDGQNTGRRFRR